MATSLFSCHFAAGPVLAFVLLVPLTSLSPSFVTSATRHSAHLRNRPQVFITPGCTFNNDCPFRNSTCNWLSKQCQCPFGYIFVTTGAVDEGTEVNLNSLNLSTVLCEPAHCRNDECRRRFKLGSGASCNRDTGLCECLAHQGELDLATNTCNDADAFAMPWWKVLIFAIFGFLIFGAIVSSCLVFWKRRLQDAKRRCARVTDNFFKE